MEGNVWRAAAFAAVATLALATPVAGALVAVPFALIAVAGRTLSEGPLFDLLADPEDRLDGELRGLVGFSLAATGLALLSALTGLPDVVFVVAVLVVGYGTLGEQVAGAEPAAGIRRVTGFVVGGGGAALAGGAALVAYASPTVDASGIAFLAVSGALLAALVRVAFVRGEDPVVMVSVALALWVLASLRIETAPGALVLAVAVAGGFGALSWALGTASITGMLTGVTIATWTIVIGGYGWFAVLIAFFGIGGLASKYRYEEKRSVGVAEGDGGARGGRNVLGNAAVALLAVVGFATNGALPAPPDLFLFAFVGSVAAAMSDTVSSEVGVVFGQPRLVTTLEPVMRGTDGGVTLHGSLAGLGGAVAIGAIALAALGIPPVGVAVVAVAGVVGMLADSVLGATVEGRWIGNQAVNFLATLVGAVVCALGAVAVGLVP